MEVHFLVICLAAPAETFFLKKKGEEFILERKESSKFGSQMFVIPMSRGKLPTLDLKFNAIFGLTE